MRIRTIVIIAVIDSIIALFGIVFVAITPIADISNTVAIALGSMLALTLGVLWSEARAGYIPALRKYTVPLFAAFALSAVFTGIMADGADVPEALKVLVLSVLSLGTGVAAFIFAADKLEKSLEQIKAPEWAQAIIPAFGGLIIFIGVTFGMIWLLANFSLNPYCAM